MMRPKGIKLLFSHRYLDLLDDVTARKHLEADIVDVIQAKVIQGGVTYTSEQIKAAIMQREPIVSVNATDVSTLFQQSRDAVIFIFYDSRVDTGTGSNYYAGVSQQSQTIHSMLNTASAYDTFILDTPTDDYDNLSPHQAEPCNEKLSLSMNGSLALIDGADNCSDSKVGGVKVHPESGTTEGEVGVETGAESRLNAPCCWRLFSSCWPLSCGGPMKRHSPITPDI